MPEAYSIEEERALKRRIKKLEKEVEALKRRQHEHFIPAYPIYPYFPWQYRRYWPEWSWQPITTYKQPVQYTNTLSTYRTGETWNAESGTLLDHSE